MPLPLDQQLLQQDGLVFAAASDAHRESLAQRAKQSLGIDVPPEYLAFLGRANGGMGNGIVLYPCDSTTSEGQTVPGLIEINERRRAWRAGLDDRIMVGEADDDYLVFCPDDGLFHRIDRVALDSCESAPTLALLIERILSRHR
jgi:hypothetical protein